VIEIYVQNYRPISILSVFSKVFEKVICKRLKSYLNHVGLPSSIQFGFQEKCSTYMAIASLIDDITLSHAKRVYRVYREPFARSIPLNANGSNEDKVKITYLNPLLSL